MLYELELQNIKPFGLRQKVPLSRLTLLYGPNSGGKRSIIQALLGGRPREISLPEPRPQVR